MKKNMRKLCGLPWWQALTAVAVCLVTMYCGVQSESITGALATCFALAVAFNAIGERIPIWNKYLGGGLLMCFFGVSLMKQFGLLPAKTVDILNDLVSGRTNFLEVFVIVPIVGSVLSIDRNVLLKSFAGFLPAIFGSIVLACLFGLLGGMLFGVSALETIVMYVLPIMGGGNGGGAVPMSQMYEQATGVPASSYYAFVIIILTIANMFTIVASAFLNALGEAKPKLTGDKKTLLRSGSTFSQDRAANIVPDWKDTRAAFLLVLGCYSAGYVLSKKILPSIAGVAIHQYAYMIVFVILLAAAGVIPASIRAGARRLQNFFGVNLTIVVMAGMGADFDIAELFRALTLSNIVMALLIVVGAVIGAGVVGYFVGFYPIDSALTAGLCMANRGGNGDLACLGAADRMELMTYAQLSSRLGGGIVLIIASFVFRNFL